MWQVREKSFDQTFSKVCALKPRRLVARRNGRNSPNGVFFLIAFSFAPVASKEKAGKKSYVVTRLHLAFPLRGRWIAEAFSRWQDGWGDHHLAKTNGFLNSIQIITPKKYSLKSIILYRLWSPHPSRALHLICEFKEIRACHLPLNGKAVKRTLWKD